MNYLEKFIQAEVRVHAWYWEGLGRKPMEAGNGCIFYRM